MVNEKMTAIADKIRILLGITGKMGLDVMATNLGTEQSNIESAFAAIGNKGGTVPDSKTSGNLSAAVESIPLGAELQRQTGTVTLKHEQNVTINCGFKPDVVFIQSGSHSDGGITYNPSTAMVFNEESRSNPFTSLYISQGIAELFWTRQTTGFSVKAGLYDYDWDALSGGSVSCYYVAIKYTN